MNENILKDFQKYLRLRNKSQSTIVCYSSDVKHFLLSNEIENIERAIVTYSTKLNQSALTKKTISRKFNSLSCFSDFLIHRGFIKNNPIKQVSYPKTYTKSQRILKDDEVIAIVDASKRNIRTFTIISLLLQTGIKISELCNLKVGDVDLEPIKAQIKIFDTNENERSVSLNDKILYILKDYFFDHKYRHRSDFPFFYSSNNKPLAIRNVRTYIARAFKEAQIKDATINDFRNTFILKQLEAGNSLKFVAKTVGHKTTMSTEKYLKLLTRKYKDLKTDRVVEV